MSKQVMLEALQPVLKYLKELDVHNPLAAKQLLNQTFSPTSAVFKKLRKLFLQGVEEKWLCNQSRGGTSFSRISKPSESSHHFSIDAVRMSGPGVWHRHTNGEINLCFANNPDARFDENPEGWVVFEPESEHIPTVTGGEMDILYFLPEGKIEW